jgi:hypothetical protein
VPLDPQRLTPTASLNRVPFIGAPAIGMPQEYEGRPAFSLLGAAALGGLLAERRQELELTTEEVASGGLSFALRARLESFKPAVAATASDIVAEYGRRLGYLVAILKRGDPESRDARPEWDESYWAHWGSVERVYLGGGLACPEMCDAAMSVVRVLGSGIEVGVAPYPVYQPMLGAARSLLISDGTALVADFGQTATKRAVETYQEGGLASMRALESIPAPGLSGLDYVRWMVETVASSVPAGATEAGLCVSSYLDEQDHPVRYAAGRFAGIHDDIQDLRGWLTEEISLVVGREIHVSLFHDATAAAIGLSPSPSAAMIMLGTALGVGFPFGGDGKLTPLAPGFAVTEAKLRP